MCIRDRWGGYIKEKQIIDFLVWQQKGVTTLIKGYIDKKKFKAWLKNDFFVPQRDLDSILGLQLNSLNSLKMTFQFNWKVNNKNFNLFYYQIDLFPQQLKRFWIEQLTRRGWRYKRVKETDITPECLWFEEEATSKYCLIGIWPDRKKTKKSDFIVAVLN